MSQSHVRWSLIAQLRCHLFYDTVSKSLNQNLFLPPLSFRGIFHSLVPVFSPKLYCKSLPVWFYSLSSSWISDLPLIASVLFHQLQRPQPYM